MDKEKSDSELSIDSLEDFSSHESSVNPHDKDHKCFRITKTESSNIVLRDKENHGKKTKVESRKKSEDRLIALSSSKVNGIFNNDDRLNIQSKGSDIYNGGSYFFCNAPRSQSARISSIQRVSRRQSVYFETPEPQRLRLRSVSYLEQFKKKHSKTNSDTVLKTLTMQSSEPPEVVSLNCASGTTMISVNKTDTSEFESYEELVLNEDRDFLNSMIDKNKQKYKVVPVNRKGHPKQRQGQSNNHEAIHPIVDLIKCVPDHFDKRTALEKREEYSKKVQLRNKAKAYRQKEMDKALKFKNSPFKAHPCEEKAHFIHQSKEQSLILDSNGIGAVPFLINKLDLSSRSVTRAEKSVKKPVKTKTKTKAQKINTEVCKLSMLQKRHESEKTVVDSFRNSFTNI